MATTRTRENGARRAAQRQGLLLRKSRRNGTYVLVDDKKGNRLAGAAAARNAFDRGEGITLDAIEDELLQAKPVQRKRPTFDRIGPDDF